MEKKDNTVPFKKEIETHGGASVHGGASILKPIIVPYSKGNEEKKDPLPQNVFLTLGPLPINGVAAAISQVEEQAWNVRCVLFAGHVAQSKIALQQPTAVPVYNIIICKVFNEGSEIVNPTLNFGQPV